MMNGMEKIKNKMEGTEQMSKLKVQTKKSNDQPQKSNPCAAETVNLTFDIHVLI
jgi:hypothetical protein